MSLTLLYQALFNVILMEGFVEIHPFFRNKEIKIIHILINKLITYIFIINSNYDQ